MSDEREREREGGRYTHSHTEHIYLVCIRCSDNKFNWNIFVFWGRTNERLGNIFIKYLCSFYIVVVAGCSGLTWLWCVHFLCWIHRSDAYFWTKHIFRFHIVSVCAAFFHLTVSLSIAPVLAYLCAPCTVHISVCCEHYELNGKISKCYTCHNIQN